MGQTSHGQALGSSGLAEAILPNIRSAELLGTYMTMLSMGRYTCALLSYFVHTFHMCVALSSDRSSPPMLRGSPAHWAHILVHIVSHICALRFVPVHRMALSLGVSPSCTAGCGRKFMRLYICLLRPWECPHGTVSAAVGVAVRASSAFGSPMFLVKVGRSQEGPPLPGSGTVPS